MSVMNRSRLLCRTAVVSSCLAALGLLVATRAPTADASQMGQMATCQASWYGAVGEIPEGWPTASGEGFHRLALRAAHNSFPFGTKVKVSYQGKSVTVIINDRGGFGGARCLDLTYGAFSKLANTDLGVINVSYEIVK